MTTGEVIALIKAFGGSGGGSSGGGVLVVHVSSEGVMDKTWQQIHDAVLTGGAVSVYPDQVVRPITSVGYPDGSGRYFIGICVADTFDISGDIFVTEDADGYPSGIAE